MTDETVGKIVAICISEKRGTVKYPVEEANLIPNWGIEGDAHAGNWHRQISLLSYEKTQEFKARGADIVYGTFGENILTEGLNLSRFEVGTTFHIGDTVMEMTQIGKLCHSHCKIYEAVGDCIMPREGVFAAVKKGGHIKVGDKIIAKAPDPNKAYTAAVITLSDKGFRGEREDKSGPLAAEILKETGYEVVEEILLPDDRKKIEEELKRLADSRQVCLIVTTGGTGFSERDVTPEATAAVCQRFARGIAEAIRAYSMTITKRAMLSRGEAGIRGKTLIVNLPGNPKAVRETLDFILPELGHGIAILRNKEKDCGR